MVPLGVVTHTCKLIEQHTALTPLTYETGDGQWMTLEREETLARAHRNMRAWCDVSGLEPMHERVVEISQPSGGCLIGYEWVVVIGVTANIHLDPGGVMEKADWTFSARVNYWSRFLSHIREGTWNRETSWSKPDRHLASVTPIRGLLPDSTPPGHGIGPSLPPPLPPTCRIDTPWADPTRYE